jgi:hypothetical protein
MKEPTKQEQVGKYLEGYTGKDLLKKHLLSDSGYWHIRGEDPNADLGGSHYQPDLGVVKGTLRNVVEYAVMLPRFYTWGYGGNITKIEIRDVDYVSYDI